MKTWQRLVDDSLTGADLIREALERARGAEETRAVGRAVSESQRGYENYTLGDATQQTLREIWTGPAYSDFRKALLSNTPPDACASCGLRWSL